MGIVNESDPVAIQGQNPIGLRGLLRPILHRVCLATVIVAYSWAILVFIDRDPVPEWSSLLAPLALGLAGGLGLLLANKHGLAVTCVALGLAAVTLLDLRTGPTQVGRWAVVATVIAMGLLAGPHWSSAYAVGLAGAVALLPAAWPAKWQLIQEAAFASVLMWVVTRNLFETLARAEMSELRSWQHAREAMERRGELRRTSKALQDMYTLLERTNHELEAARREAEEAKEVKARFAANISHELRTPLNLIMGFSHTMYSSPEVYGDMRWPPELRMDIHEIYSASRHLLGMIDDILDLARIEAHRLPLKLEPTDLLEVLAEAVATGRGLLRGSEVEIRLRLPEELPQVHVDRTRILQVLLNLLNNAIRFTDRGEIVVAARAEDGEVHISVSDTGTGIPAEDLPFIFDEFSQARGPITSGRGGAGLGLAVCREFVQMHGGRISAESEVGKGSTFSFALPLPDTGRSRSRLSYYLPDGWTPPISKNPLGKSVIVLAPDEATSRQLARGVVGYRAIPLSDISALREAVETEHPAGVVLVRDALDPARGVRCEEIWQATGRPDLGVVEYEMPLPGLARDYLQVDDYLIKPVQAESLVAAVQRCGAGTDRFLVVDDDTGFRTLVRRVLSSVFPRATLRSCAGGREALAMLERERFDVVLLDLVMPGMSGMEFLNHARRRSLLNGTKVVVSTGAALEVELARLLPSRIVFSKKAPPRGAEWLNCIRALLDAAPPDYSHSALAAEPSAEPQLSQAS
ncbi:MAG: hybrid sensor histidine kinase/response regulator [Anaerolineae bacterium]|jgi:signal transduction histidine kinase/CheY-like chemotaxis protein